MFKINGFVAENKRNFRSNLWWFNINSIQKKNF